MIEQLIKLVGGVIASIVGAVVGWKLSQISLRRKTQISQIDHGRQRGRYAIAVGVFTLLSVGLWTELLRPQFLAHSLRSQTADLVRKHKWIAYEPADFNPSRSGDLDLEVIREELRSIHKAGFDGIITFTSRGAFSEIPKLAKNQGFAVIMGVWDPGNYAEIGAAISQREYVDAYCVGHDGWPFRYSYDTLIKAIDHVRFRTGRPVSTTQRINYYLTDQRFLAVGDWLFPDTLLPLIDKELYVHSIDVKRDVTTTIELANKLDQINQDHKPILLKMVGYPALIDDPDIFSPNNSSSNVPNDAQTKFFIALGNAQKDVGTSLSTNISISMYSVFDIRWKRGAPFYDWESQTGLFEDDGSPRPAVWEIIKRRLHE